MDDFIEHEVLRVDFLLRQRDEMLARIPVANVLDFTDATYDRRDKLTCRIDFFRRWVDLHGRPKMRRLSVRISEVDGGFKFSQFQNGGISFEAYAPQFSRMGVYDKVMLLT